MISFAPWSQCPTCKVTIDHPLLEELMAPVRLLKEEVERKALMRLEFEKKDKDPEIVEEGGAFFGKPAAFALNKYNYYMCCKCDKPYFGGERDCGAGAAGDDFDPQELVCAGCSGGTAEVCPKHGVSPLRNLLLMVCGGFF